MPVLSANHYILLQRCKLVYGRIPKVANSSIKNALASLLERPFARSKAELFGLFLRQPHRFPPLHTLKSILCLPSKQRLRLQSDLFWRHSTGGQTAMIKASEALSKSSDHLIFSFVRSPFDRLISAYNNKLVLNPPNKVPRGFAAMGLRHGMPFENFVQIIASTPDDNTDIHLVSQTAILAHGGRLVPQFVGRLENFGRDWHALRALPAGTRLPAFGEIPRRNVRRSQKGAISDYFCSKRLIDLVLLRYGDDLSLFYKDAPTDALLANKSLEQLEPIQRSLPIGVCN